MNSQSAFFIIPLKVYPFDVAISIGQSNNEIEESLKKYSIDYSDVNVKWDSNTQRGRCLIFHDNKVLIRMDEFKSSPVWFGYLQHEVFHAVEFTLNRIGMELSFKSDEAYAYLIQYITTKVYEKIPKYFGPIKLER